MKESILRKHHFVKLVLSNFLELKPTSNENASQAFLCAHIWFPFAVLIKKQFIISVPGDRVLIVLWYKDGYGKIDHFKFSHKKTSLQR